MYFTVTNTCIFILYDDINKIICTIYTIQHVFVSNEKLFFVSFRTFLKNTVADFKKNA